MGLAAALAAGLPASPRAGAPPPAAFEDVTRAVGLSFVYVAGALYPL
jgi:hypothetical protein